MLDLILAAALAQAAPATPPPLPPPNPCFAVPVPAQPATCPRWRSTSNSPAHQTWADPAIIRNGGNFEVRSWIVFNVDREGARSVLLRHRHDCTARTATVLLATIYDARGVQLAEFPPEGAEAGAAPVVAGSPGAAEQTMFCPR